MEAASLCVVIGLLLEEPDVLISNGLPLTQNEKGLRSFFEENKRQQEITPKKKKKKKRKEEEGIGLERRWIDGLLRK